MTRLPRAVSRSSKVGSGGGTAIVMAVVGPLEGGGGLADERPCDHPPDSQRINQPAHDLTEFVKPLEPEMALMRGDLQDRVDRGVADRLAGADVLLAEPLDDLGARRMAVAEDARHLALADHRRGQIRRKGGNRIREIAPVETHRQRRRSPNGRTACPCRSKPPAPRHGRRWRADPSRNGETQSCRRFGRLAKPERRHVGDKQRPAAKPLAIRAALGAGFGDMRERVGAGVAIAFGIGRAADAERIQDEEESARHRVIVASLDAQT